MEMMNTTLEEAAKRKVHVLHAWAVGWVKNGTHKDIPRISEER